MPRFAPPAPAQEIALLTFVRPHARVRRGRGRAEFEASVIRHVVVRLPPHGRRACFSEGRPIRRHEFRDRGRFAADEAGSDGIAEVVRVVRTVAHETGGQIVRL